MKRFKLIKRIALFLLVVMLTVISSFGIGLKVKAAKITINGVDLIYTNPGEDCSTEITISWHASKSISELTYTEATDTNYEKATTLNVTGVYDKTSFIYYDVAQFYKCSVELKDLIPNTRYIYKVTCDKVTSEEHTFVTAGAPEFTFGYMSDIHAVPYDNLDKGMTAIKRLQTVQTLIDNATTESGDLSFILTTGDEVWRGSQYSNWQEWSKTRYTTALNDYLWFSCAGNHEYYTQTTDSVWNYYPDKYATNTSAIYSDPDYFYNTYFKAVKSVPKNGPDGIESCYWSIYNNVLFICIDSMMTSEYGQLNKIRNWFEEVVNKNDGNYQYIIVYQHYPWYDFQTGEDKYHYRWDDLFDKYGVDLALSGHYHGYLRTYSLYDGKVNTDESRGTVYVVSPQIGDRPKDITGYSNENLFAMRESQTKWPSYSAMSTISVTSEGLTYKLIDVEGTVRDEFTIKSKRSMSTSGNAKQNVINSLTLSASENSIMCDMKSSLSPYVDNIKLNVDGKVFKCYPAEKRNVYVVANPLEANKIYDVKITVTFTDGTTYITNKSILTTNAYGVVSDAKVESNNGKMNISWDGDSKYIYKVYLDNELLGNASNNTYAIDLDKVNFGSKYSLEAYDGNVLIYRTDLFYTTYGDVNLDGKLNEDDVLKLIDLVLSGYEFNESAIKLLDNNEDGIVDIGDAYRILAYKENVIEKVSDKTYEVIFLGFDSSIVSKKKVGEGDDAEAPEAKEIEGYTFVGWSVSFTNVHSDLIVRAIYKENE